MERERSGGKRAKVETSVRIIWKEVDRSCETRLTKMPKELECYCNCNHIYQRDLRELALVGFLYGI